jgi:hypothetical protein
LFIFLNFLQIAKALQPLMFPAPEHEREAIGNLRKMQQRLLECRREIKKVTKQYYNLAFNGRTRFCPFQLNERLHEHRRSLFIGEQPTSSSALSSASGSRFDDRAISSGGGTVPAQLFALSKKSDFSL